MPEPDSRQTAAPAAPPSGGVRLLRHGARQLGRRLVQLVVLLVGVSTLLFALLRLTGDPAVALAGEGATAEQIAQVREFHGLDRPLPVQYVEFLGQFARLDFGQAYGTNRDALAMVVERIPVSISLALTAVAVNLVCSLLAGAYLGHRPERAGRRVTVAAVLVSQGIPAFVVGLLLIQVFAVQLRWLPSIGNATLVSYVLPSVTLASFLLPRTIRLTAAGVREAMAQQYVRTARAGGATTMGVLWRHAVPNALLGTVALVGVQFGFLMGGSLIVESLFAWPGIGLLMIEAVRTVNFPVIQAAVFVIAALVFAVTAVVDLVLPLLDPRLREQLA